MARIMNRALGKGDPISHRGPAVKGDRRHPDLG